MLFAKAKRRTKTYSVIGQGIAENFLNTNASERKDFFDEANVGVKQFQIKREMSLNKLESSYENLQQVEMLLVEIRPRPKSLTRQEKLKRRSEIEAELISNQFNYYHFLYEEASSKLEAANAKFF